MSDLLSTIACNLDRNMLSAALPLFETEKVAAIEWSFDTLFKTQNIPPWFVELLEAFGNENRLIGHGVFFSLFTGKWLPEQATWLKHLQKVSQHFHFDHITEHFGFMTGKDFHKGAPINIPFTPTTLAIGRDRLQRIQQTCQCPVGLENLAFAYSLEEVRKHGDFLHQLLAPINGFLILDLHNLYCQIHNFDLSLEELLPLYPLESVREIHISGGSWEASFIEPSKKIRRDTHDDAVPQAVFDLLEKTIPQCPNLKFVVLEQIGTGLETVEKQAAFRTDFHQMDQIVQQANAQSNRSQFNDFLPQHTFDLAAPIEDLVLYEEQMQLSTILETAPNFQEAQRALLSSNLANSPWAIETWEPSMLETVLKIAQKWKTGF